MAAPRRDRRPDSHSSFIQLALAGDLALYDSVDCRSSDFEGFYVELLTSPHSGLTHTIIVGSYPVVAALFGPSISLAATLSVECSRINHSREIDRSLFNTIY